ncbi:unnamed protein product, partial [Meganyctiphanes norvegica]
GRYFKAHTGVSLIYTYQDAINDHHHRQWEVDNQIFRKRTQEHTTAKSMDNMIIAHTMLGVLTFVINPARSAQSCPYPYKLVGQECLVVYTNTTVNFDNAREVCSRLNGYIIKPENLNAFQNHIQNIYGKKNGSDIWIGATKGTHGWHWESSSLEQRVSGMIDIPWGNGEPSGVHDGQLELCLSLTKHADTNFHYNDVRCQDSNIAICETS